MDERRTKTDGDRPRATCDDGQQLASVIARLSTDQIRFVVMRQECASDREAAEAIDVSPSTVKDWKYKGAPIDAAVRLMATDGLIVATELRRRNLAKAMGVKVKGLDSESERTRQGVASEIIEWEMGKAKQTVDSMVSGPGGGPVDVIIGWKQQDGDKATPGDTT